VRLLNVDLAVAEAVENVGRLRWSDLSDAQQEALRSKLSGLWDTETDKDAFEALAVDKQQALLLILSRLRAKGLWDVVRKITNLYGEAGVGIEFIPWPVIESKLTRRKDFTRRLATHRNTSGGFYEKGRADAALHFLYVDETSRQWHLHFDLYSPVHSASSALKHLRHELIGKVRPDWRIIQQRLKS
jgi:hypothetical protein